MIRVVIADDHTLVRDGIGVLIGSVDDIEVVGAAASGTEAIDLVHDLAPDVLVVDVTMPDLSGIEVTERLVAEGTDVAIVVLTMHAETAVVSRAMRAGARAYVIKDSAVEELLVAIRTAASGALYLSPSASELRPFDEPAAAPATEAAPSGEAADLTPRETEVLQLIAEGLTNRAVADRLGISVKTVERHRTSIMAKLDAHSIVELIRIGVNAGLIDLSTGSPPG